jgi:hypothetical protein
MILKVTGGIYAGETSLLRFLVSCRRITSPLLTFLPSRLLSSGFAVVQTCSAAGLTVSRTCTSLLPFSACSKLNNQFQSLLIVVTFKKIKQL